MHIKYLLRYLQITNFSTINRLNFTHLLGARVDINILLIFDRYTYANKYFYKLSLESYSEIEISIISTLKDRSPSCSDIVHG